MNAPATVAAVAPATPPAAGRFAEIPLTDIGPSTTHIQALRRQRFDAAALGELAASITALGVAQPIVVTPYKLAPGLNPTGKEPKFVIVAGERRWLAAKLAKTATIPASIRELSPEQILEIQLVENLQREGLHEMEEAEGYSELMKLKGLNADQVGELISKSRAHVFARLKLLDLCPEARKAFYAGEVQASVALLIARIPQHDTQHNALKDCIQGYDDDHEFHQGPLTYRKAQQCITEQYIADLKKAPFKLDDATLAPKAGACTTCPKRTGNQKDLFTDVKNTNACTDTTCLDGKRVAWYKRLADDAAAKGRTIITGKAAEAIFSNRWVRDQVLGGYLAANAPCPDHPKRAKINTIVDADAILLAQHPDTGALIEVVRSTAVTAALNAKGIKTERQKMAEQTAQSRKANDTARLDDATQALYDKALLQALRGNYTAKLEARHLRLVAAQFLSMATSDLYTEERETLIGLWPALKGKLSYGEGALGLYKTLASFDTAQLGALMLDTLFLSCDTEDLIDLEAKEQKIDTKALLAQAKVDAKFVNK